MSPKRFPEGERPRGRLLDDLRAALRVRQRSLHTEKAYCDWVKRFILFHGKRHPREMGAPEITAFLSYLAEERNVAVSTQNQALNAIVFLYKHVLDVEPGVFEGLVRPKRPPKLPVVLTRDEVRLVLAELGGLHRTIGTLLYGTGMRLQECLRLRVQDMDFGMRQIIVRSGKGGKDRVTVLPQSLTGGLEEHLVGVRELHRKDLDAGFGRVYLPKALAVKYPRADQQWGWQWVFPAQNLSTDPRGGIRRRHHLSPRAVQRAVQLAIGRARVTKAASCHTFRHCFATHLLEDGYDIRTVQKLLGHKNVKTTEIYTHVLRLGAGGVRSPADRL